MFGKVGAKTGTGGEWSKKDAPAESRPGMQVGHCFACLDVRFQHANTEHFQGLVPLWSHFCPLSVQLGGYVGHIRKALEKGYSECPGLHAVLTTCLRFLSALDGGCVACCIFLLTGSHHVLIQIHTVASPDAPLKPLVRKRARSGGETWVQVTRRPDSRAKKPRLGGSQHHACAHSEHQILSTTEATAFAAQFWEKKTHPTKASQHEFLATCIDVNLEQNVKHAGRQKYTRKRGHQTKHFVHYRGSRRQICKTQFLRYFKISRIVVESVAKVPNPYISETAFSHRFQKAYTSPPPPPEVTTFWCIGPKVEKTLKNCEFAPRWHILDVPERCCT